MKIKKKIFFFFLGWGGGLENSPRGRGESGGGLGVGLVGGSGWM